MSSDSRCDRAECNITMLEPNASSLVVFSPKTVFNEALVREVFTILVWTLPRRSLLAIHSKLIVVCRILKNRSWNRSRLHILRQKNCQVPLHSMTIICYLLVVQIKNLIWKTFTQTLSSDRNNWILNRRVNTWQVYRQVTWHGNREIFQNCLKMA